MATNIPRAQIEDTTIRWANFAGKKGKYNEEGQRNFNLFLDQDVARRLVEDGWNVKYLQPKDEGEDPQPILKVNVKYHKEVDPEGKTEWRGPSIVLISSRGRQNLGINEINILDWMAIKTADVILNPYQRDSDSPITAYLHKLFVVMEEDDLDRKYASVPDSAQNSIGYDPRDEDE